MRTFRIQLFAGSIVLMLAPVLSAATGADAAKTATSRTPTPWQDDAALHDVFFATSRKGWAVGNLGVIWHTRDGGATWELQSSGVDCPLRSVCFLTERVGWIAGGGVEPYSHASTGVLLATRDGGETWQPFTSSPLPSLYRVRLFSPDHGYVAGQTTPQHPTGLLYTEDGGKHWNDVVGRNATNWRAMSFHAPGKGAVAGLRGGMGLIVEGALESPRGNVPGLRGLSAMMLQTRGQGWLVGDGAQILRTSNGGLVWQAPATSLPEEARHVFDFRTVFSRGDLVWIAGAPGSVVWHSKDAGRTWRRQATGQTLPLSSLFFRSDSEGVAVGALGVVLQTDDAGTTWNIVRGADRRLACLAWHARTDQVSLNLVVALAGEQGYRTGALVLAREDVGPDGDVRGDGDERLANAVAAVGGGTADIDWPFPLAIPGLDRDREQLIADWNRRTEGRLGETLSGRLVRHLRTWRPSVVVLDQPASTDAVGQLSHQALLSAIAAAADSTRFLEQRELAALSPWQVRKIYLRAPPGSTGSAYIDPYTFLPRLGKTVQSAAAPAQATLADPSPGRVFRDAYLAIDGAGRSLETKRAGDFFTGLDLSPATGARRELPLLDEDALNARLELARRQRNASAVIDRSLSEPRKSAQLIGQLGDLIRGQPDADAALQLSQLAESYFSTGQWTLGEMTLIELVERYPDELPTLAAVPRLMQFWASEETTWRRQKQSMLEEQHVRTTPDETLRKVEQAAARLDAQERAAEEGRPPAALTPARINGVKQAEFERDTATDRGALDRRLRFWQDRALQLSQFIQRRAPALYDAPEVQFPLASLHRRRQTLGLSDAIYRRFAQDNGSAWSTSAAGEIWMSTPAGIPDRTFVQCYATPTRPLLDGVLSDECWQDATELLLTSAPDEVPDPEKHALAMICRDGEFLYFAASFPRHPGALRDGPLKTGRKHDEVLADFDRVTLLLDIDRDYVTYYRFSMDQRGCTEDACWQDPSWNPRWFVAADGDESHWRIEAAIPLEELGPKPPREGDVWNVGIIRVAPAATVQTWTHPTTSRPRPETFGLVKFE